MIWAWIDGERGFGFWGMLPMVVLGVWVIGASVFYKVVIDSETITKYSSFFGIPKKIRLKKVTRIVVVANFDEIKLYIGKVRVLSLPHDMAGGMRSSIEYFERAGIKVEYKDHSKLYYWWHKLP